MKFKDKCNLSMFIEVKVEVTSGLHIGWKKARRNFLQGVNFLYPQLHGDCMGINTCNISLATRLV